MGKRTRLVAVGVLILAIGAGLLLFRDRGRVTRPSFHDIRVNHPPDLSSLVDPSDSAVRALAGRLRTPESAYAFVRDRIRYVPTIPASPPGETLRTGTAGCLGKATLLCSLYRAMGFPASDVRVVTGDVVLPEGVADHAWVDLEYRGECLQQDPSGFLGVFGFAEFPGTKFTRSFVYEEEYCFNDQGFALVSQLNRFRKEAR